jgi:hypothetical protein
MQKQGIMIVSTFAAVWFLWGMSAAPVPAWLLAVPVLLTGTFILRAAKMPSTPSTPARRREIKVIAWASAGEGVGMMLAANILQWTGLQSYFPCAVAALVGLHFVPMVWLADRRGDILPMAGLLTIAAVGCLIPDAVTRLQVVGVSAAMLLWSSCLFGVATGRSPAAEPV